jgi:hypothetical protein
LVPARRFDADPIGFDGINYRSRFAITDSVESWAIFGDAGVDETRPIAVLSMMDGHAACREVALP